MKLWCVVAIFGFFFNISGVSCLGESGKKNGQQVSDLETKCETAGGKEKADLLNRLAFAYISLAPLKCIKNANKALEISKSLKYLRGISEAYRILGVGHAIVGKTGKALDYFQKALEVAKKTGDPKVMAKVLVNIGSLYTRMSQPREALGYQLRALKIAGDSRDKRFEAVILSNLGVTYMRLYDNTTALETYHRSLDLYDGLDIKYDREVSNVIMNIGHIYLDMKQPDRALEYFHRALKLKEKVGDKAGLADVYAVTANAYQYREDYKRALEYNRKALAVAEEMGLNTIIPRVTGSMGTIYENLEEPRRAMACYKKSLDIGKKIDDKLVTGLALISIGKLQISGNEYENALNNLLRGLAIAGKIGKKDLAVRAYKSLSLLFESEGDYKKALEYHKRLREMEYQLLNETNQRQVNDLQAKYENEKKEKEIIGLKKNSEIKDLKLDRATFTRNAFIIGFILVLIILVLLYKKYLYLFAFWKKKKYVGRYRLMNKIASGGMGVVFKAHSITDKSDISAVKILRDELFVHDVSKKRFRRESSIVDKLEHPHIVAIHERGESRQQLFIAMEYLDGKTLETLLKENGPMPFKRSVDIMSQIAEAIAFIHSKRVIHRDLKPANIMLIHRNGRPDFVKLLDFGLSRMEFDTRLTHTGNFLGTTEYVSPEQVKDAEVSAASDIFAMGVIFYRMLWARSPFPGDTVIDIMSRIIHKAPLPVTGLRTDIPPELTNLVMVMLHKKPELRPTAESIRITLQEFEKELYPVPRLSDS